MSGLKLDAYAGIAEYVHFDEADNSFTHQILQDVEPILENAKANALQPNAGKNPAKDMYHAGRFPLVLVEEWLRQRKLKFADFKGDVVREFLNDDNHAAFRIWKGQA